MMAAMAATNADAGAAPNAVAGAAADARVARVVAFYESLTPGALDALAQVYADDARFIDPFNDVQGTEAIRRVFDHMFATLAQARFEVLETVTQGDACFLLWNFHLRRNAASRPMTIHGASHLRFAPDGRVAWHRDHWDAAGELYEKLPLLGALMRALRRHLRA